MPKQTTFLYLQTFVTMVLSSKRTNQVPKGGSSGKAQIWMKGTYCHSTHNLYKATRIYKSHQPHLLATPQEAYTNQFGNPKVRYSSLAQSVGFFTWFFWYVPGLMPTLIFCWYMDVLMCLRFLWLHRGICYSQVFAIPLSHKSEYTPIPERSVQGCIGSIWICRASEEIFWACYSEVQLQVLRLWRLSTRILQATEHTYAPWYGPANLVTWNASISFNFIISLRSSEVKMDTWHVHLFLLNQLLWEPARGFIMFCPPFRLPVPLWWFLANLPGHVINASQDQLLVIEGPFCWRRLGISDPFFVFGAWAPESSLYHGCPGDIWAWTICLFLLSSWKLCTSRCRK